MTVILSRSPDSEQSEGEEAGEESGLLRWLA